MVCVCFKSNMSKRREVGLFMVSLIHTAYVTTESILGSGTEHLVRAGGLNILVSFTSASNLHGSTFYTPYVIKKCINTK